MLVGSRNAVWQGMRWVQASLAATHRPLPPARASSYASQSASLLFKLLLNPPESARLPNPCYGNDLDITKSCEFSRRAWVVLYGTEGVSVAWTWHQLLFAIKPRITDLSYFPCLHSLKAWSISQYNELERSAARVDSKMECSSVSTAPN